MARAGGFFERALVLDPENVGALVGIAAVDVARATLFLADNPEVRLAAAEAALTKALSLAPQHALAHMYLGIVLFASNRAAQGLAECEHASALNQNLAEAHASIGAAKLFVSRAEDTEAHIQEALRLSPRDPGIHRWMGYVGNAKILIGADAEAVVWLRQSLKANPNYPFAQFLLAAALAFLGELDEARAAVKAGLALDPTFTVRRFIRISLGPRGGSGRVRQGMRLAGVPEG